tara:strand:- start:109 stop:378 length:270 start_codon:yes stop_codon:yes gene_type:complete
VLTTLPDLKVVVVTLGATVVVTLRGDCGLFVVTLFSTGFSTVLGVVVDNLTAFAGVAFLAVVLRVLVFLVPVVDLVDLVAVVGIKTKFV